MNTTNTALAIDPGRQKCGVAVVNRSGILYKAVVSTEEIPTLVPDLMRTHNPDCIIVGAGTTGRNIADALRANMPGIEIRLVDERNSTLRARARFFQDNPARGLMRLVPKGMRVPDRPYDDYVAVILAEDYLSVQN